MEIEVAILTEPTYLVIPSVDNDPHLATRGKKRVEAVTGTTRRQKPITGAAVGDDKKKNSWRGSRCLQDFAWVARERWRARPADTGIDYEQRPHPLPPSAALKGWPTAAATHAASREKSCAVVVSESLRLPLFRLRRSIPTP